MNKSASSKSFVFYLTLPALLLSIAGVFLSVHFGVEAQTREQSISLDLSDQNPEPERNFDIRIAGTPENGQKLTKFRNDSGKTAADIALIRDGFVRGEEKLRATVPNLKIEYNQSLRIPEVISPDFKQENYKWLTSKSQKKKSEILRSFGKQNKDLLGVSETQLEALEVTADYVNPAGNMGFAHLRQTIGGIPVFQGEIKAGFTIDGEIVRVINNLAPAIETENVSPEFGNPADAVRSALKHIGDSTKPEDLDFGVAKDNGNLSVFGKGDWATTAEKIYFPTEIGVVRSAWLVLIWGQPDSFYVAVDAETGLILWRKNITESQSQTSVFDVYSSSTAWMKSMDSPAPLTPGPNDPNTGNQGTLAVRGSVTAIGNEAPNPGMNNLGWITDNTNITDGNNVEAGIDRDGTSGVDAPQPGDGTCPGPGCRSFTSGWNPPPGNPPPGDDPLNPVAQRGAVIQYFYLLNRFHDSLYEVGFNEAAGNFQDSNFGRGGVGSDRLSAEAQDSSGTNGANAAFAADGLRGRIQMFIWTGPNPDRDGAADNQIVVHEATHGVSARLHGNGSGLSSNMSRGMGEGWSDFYAQTLLSESGDPISGVYATAGYIGLDILGTPYTANYYYGFRRFPLAVRSFTGGPQNRPHNPLTFGNLNAGNCSSFDGAFPPGPLGSGACDQVHKAGEIWSSALWEVRGNLISRLGWSAGTLRTLQVVTDGMKLSPLNPTFLQGRDAIIAAAAALPDSVAAASDVRDVKDGFRKRGMGFSAQIIDTSPAVVVEAFDLPGGRADFDGDGKTDISVFRPNEGNWYLLNSTAGFSVIRWGLDGDQPVPADYDGDGKADIAVFRPSNTAGEIDWWILNSNGFTFSAASWGIVGDTPLVSDYDGDGKSDIALWRGSEAVLYVLKSTGSVTIKRIGFPGHLPVIGDFDGDGKADPTTVNLDEWTTELSTGGVEVISNGQAGDQRVVGDFDGDGKSDRVSFKNSSGLWQIRHSSTGNTVNVNFGAGTDLAVPGDYDGDGKDDVAIYRNGQWWVNGSTSGLSVVNFGLSTDLAIVRTANP